MLQKQMQKHKRMQKICKNVQKMCKNGKPRKIVDFVDFLEKRKNMQKNMQKNIQYCTCFAFVLHISLFLL